MLIRTSTAANKKSRSSFYPDFISKSTSKIDFGVLKKMGITDCLIDLDGTVVDRGTFEVDPLISGALERSGLRIHIATNRPKS